MSETLQQLQQQERDLLRALVAKQPELAQLLEECSGHWSYEDPVYRFYHQSYKVFALQHTTLRIVDALKALAPHRPRRRAGPPEEPDRRAADPPSVRPRHPERERA